MKAKTIWRATSGDVVYEVRAKGEALRLYANDIQHSEYHPQKLVTGSVWDLLWLPVLFHEPAACRRVLVLGLGGGTLIPPLRYLLGPVEIIAAEKDPLHLEVAREVFHVGDDQLTMVCDDARDWVVRWQGEPFDLVVEDLFAPADRSVSRAIKASGSWFGDLSRLVSAEGSLVMNFGDWPEYRDSPLSGQKYRRGWGGAYRFATPDCHNAVIAWLRHDSHSGALRQRLWQDPRFCEALRDGLMDYSVRRLF